MDVKFGLETSDLSKRIENLDKQIHNTEQKIFGPAKLS